RSISAHQTVIDRLCMAGTIVMCSSLLAIGIGLARRDGWSRWAAIVWSTLAVLWLAIAIVREGVQAQARRETLETWLLASFAPQCWAAIFPTTMLALLGRASASRDFHPR